MESFYYTGFADEAGVELDKQIAATRELGWNYIEMRAVAVPGFEAGNLHDIPEPAFEALVARLEETDVRISSLGSGIANGGKDIRKPFDPCQAAARRAAVRGRRLGAEFVRVMSYPVGDPSDLFEEERFRRLREIVRIFEGSGVTVVHENCSNYGGMGWRYSLKLVENVPGLKLVFDTGNTVADKDYCVTPPLPRQSSLDFFRHVREHVAYIHVKDAISKPDGSKPDHVFPGEGQGEVFEVLGELLHGGYPGGLSIEPHMGAGISDSSLSKDENAYLTYIEYGRRLMKIVDEIRTGPTQK